MKISHLEKREKEIEIIDDILCNQCGKSIVSGKIEDKVYSEGLREQVIACGYGSELGDGNYYRFSLCEPCLQVMFDGFKIPVTKTVAGWIACEDDNVEPNTFEM